MLEKYITTNGAISKVPDIIDNSWISMIAPDYSELSEVATAFDIDMQDLTSVMDLDESSRIEINDTYTLIIIDIPFIELRNNAEAFTTIPLAIILTDKNLITVCAVKTSVLDAFKDGRIKGVDFSKKTRFLYQILYNTSNVYLDFLRQIDTSRKNIETNASEKKSTDNAELLKLHELEANLVYFNTSLRSNNIVLNKLSRYNQIKRYPEDQELLEDVLIENAQAIEMVSIFRDILVGTRELLASLIDNNLNLVMKRLTTITIVMSIPNIISGFYGMNVDTSGMPLAHVYFGFPLIVLTTFLTCLIIAIVLKHKNLF